MSGVDFVARALALRAVATAGNGGGSSPAPAPSPDAPPLALRTFAAMKADPPAISGTAIASAGHTEAGSGHALYVCDGRATAALAASHPLACLTAKDGRVFRLCDDGDGFIAPEQIGCPVYQPGRDQRASLQAALDYARAMGLSGLKLPQRRYELWATPRAGAFSDEANSTGCFLVIDGWPCTLIGLHPTRTTLDCKGPRGQNLQNDYQTLTAVEHGGEVIWRGHGIRLTGSAPLTDLRPASTQLAALKLRNIALRSDAVGVGNTASPALPLSRDPTGQRENCRDPSNQAISHQPGVHTGDTVLDNVEVAGFLGDAILGPAGYQARLALHDVAVRDSNGPALVVPGVAILAIDTLTASNCGASWAGFGGLASSTISATRFLGCGTGGIDSAGAQADGLRKDGTAPVTLFDVSFENCAEQRIGSYTLGRIAAIDTPLALAPQSATQVVRGIDLDVTTTCHKAHVAAALRVAGYSGTTAAISHNTIRLTMNRTRTAADSGFTFTDMAVQSGPLGPQNYLYARGQPARIGTVSGVTGSYVAIIDQGLDLSTSATAPTPFDPSKVASPDMGTGAVTCSTFSGGNGVYTVNLPATTMYPDGAQISIDHRDSSKPLALVEIMDNAVRKALLGWRDTLLLRCNRLHARWDILRAPAPRSATASIAIASTALNAESGPYTIALTGCRGWHKVEVSPPGTIGGFAISNVRAETDIVRFWAKNLNGVNPSSLAAQTFTARCSVHPS